MSKTFRLKAGLHALGNQNISFRANCNCREVVIVDVMRPAFGFGMPGPSQLPVCHALQDGPVYRLVFGMPKFG